MEPSPKKHYRKLAGHATTSGQMYEAKMAALLFLRGVHSGLDFQLASNAEGAGILDDVVFRFKKPDSDWTTCFIQLKHKDHSRLGLVQLTELKGKFSLKLYFDSYKVIKKSMTANNRNVLYDGDIENCMCIMFTNLKPNISLDGVGDKISEQVAEFLKSGKGQILCFNPDGETEVEKEVLKSLGDCDEAKDFMRCLAVFCGQPDESEFDDLIEKELESSYKEYASRLRECFVENIKIWCENSKAYLLENSSDILKRSWNRVVAEECEARERNEKLDICFVDDALLPMKEKLKETFTLLHVDCSKSSCRLSCNKFLQAAEACRSYSLETFSKHHSALISEWRASEKNYLVLYVKDSFSPVGPENFRKYINTITAACDNADTKQRVVIICRADNHMLKESDKALELRDGFTTFEDTFHFSQIDNKTQDRILSTEIIHQGRATRLIRLLGDNRELANGVIEASSVTELSDSDRPISLGPALANDIAYYIPRFLERTATVKDEIFRIPRLPESVTVVHSTPDDVATILLPCDPSLSRQTIDDALQKFSCSPIVSSDGERFSLGSLECSYVRLRRSEVVTTALRFHPAKNEGGCFVFVSKETDEQDVEALSVECGAAHRLRYEGGELRWTESRGAGVGVVRDHLDEARVEAFGSEVASGLGGRLILLAAEPGMGKTTLLTHAAKHAKEECPSNWVVTILLNEQDELFADGSYGNVLKFLSEATGIKSPAERALFKLALEVTGNLVVLVDGFDEISPRYLEECFVFLSYLLETKVAKVWVTSRNSFKTKLEDRLCTLAFRLRKFNEEDQRNFFKMFWEPARSKFPHSALPGDKLDDFIARLIEQTSRDMKDWEKDMLGIPLLTQMMAEIYQDQVTGLTEMSTRFDKMDLLKLLEEFVDKKIRLNMEDKENMKKSHAKYARKFEKNKRESENNHMLAALFSVFSAEQVEKLISKRDSEAASEFLDEIKRGDDETGIIDSVHNDKPRFIHRVFAEYFAAMWFAANFEGRKETVEEMLYTTDVGIIRNILDRILAKGFPLHTAVLNNDQETMHNLLSTSTSAEIQATDDGGRTAMHLAAGYIAVESPTENKHQNIIHYLLHWHISDLSSREDRVLGAPAYRYADLARSWAALELLLPAEPVARHLRVALASPADRAMLDCVLAHDLHRLLAVLLDNGLSADHAFSDTGQRFLARACHCGSVGVVACLLVGGAAPGRIAGDDDLPLHIAAKRGHEKIVHLLCIASKLRLLKKPILPEIQWIVHSSNISFDGYVDFTVDRQFVNARDTYGRTALHYAAEHGHASIVRLLISGGGDVGCRDEISGATPLHYAVLEESDDEDERTVAMLMPDEVGPRRSQCCDAVDNDGDTALHQAAAQGCVRHVRDLGTFGSDIWRVNNGGMTALMLAAENGHSKVASYLLETYGGGSAESVKARVNATNRRGFTAAHLAALNGHADTVAVLAERGADLRCRDPYGETALHKAAECNRPDAVRALMEAVPASRKASYARMANNSGKTALALATAKNNVEVMSVLAEYDSGGAAAASNGELHDAVTAGRVELVVDLIGRGADIWRLDEEFARLPLHVAAEKGSVELVGILIAAEEASERARYVNVADKNGNTALHWAAGRENTLTVKFLVDSGSKVDSVNLVEETPLHAASLGGNLDEVKNILKSFDEIQSSALTQNETSDVKLAKRDYINRREKDGWTAIHNASNEGHAEVVMFLIEQGADIRTVDVEFGCTPLLDAAEQGHASVLRVLINALPEETREEYVNAVDKLGNTALLLAARATSLESVELLVNAGSKITHANHCGDTALMNAAIWESQEIVKYLLECFDESVQGKADYIKMKDDEGLTALHRAALNGNGDAVRRLVEHGANVWLPGGHANDTALHCAAESENVDAVRAVLFAVPHEERSDFVNSVNSDGDTALHLAALYDSLESVALLVRAGSKVAAENKDGETPMSLAASNGRLEAVRFLLEYRDGVDPVSIKGDGDEIGMMPRKNGSTAFDCVNKTNVKGETALFHAVWNGHEDVALFLMGEGADFVNYRDEEGGTLLHIAVSNNDACIVKVLIEALKKTVSSFPDYVDKSDRYGESALSYAVSNGYKDLTSLLIDHGAKVVDYRDYYVGSTLLHIAVKKNHPCVVKILIDAVEREVIDELSSTNLGKKRKVIKDYIDKLDGSGRTALHLAVAAGSLESVEHIWKAGGDVVNGVNETPLIQAARNGNLEIAKRLLEFCDANNGVDRREYILMRDHFNRSAMNYAAWNKHTNIVDLLNGMLLDQQRLVKVGSRGMKRRRK